MMGMCVIGQWSYQRCLPRVGLCSMILSSMYINDGYDLAKHNGPFLDGEVSRDISYHGENC